LESKYCYWQFKDALPDSDRKKIKRIARKSGYVEASTKNSEQKKNKKDGKVRNTDVSFSNDEYLYDTLTPFVYRANEDAGWKYDVDYFEGDQIARYRKNQHYSWHEDGRGDHFAAYAANADDKNYIGKVRKLTLVACISNGYEGGDLEFALHKPEEEENLILQPKMEVGDIIVFPSYVSHRSTAITKGTKYSVSMWSLGPPFR